METSAVYFFAGECFLQIKSLCLCKGNFYGNAYEIFERVPMVLAGKELLKYVKAVQAMGELVEVRICSSSLIARFGLGHQLKYFSPEPWSGSF